MTAKYSRRDLLRAGVATALVPNLPARRARANVPSDVVVIGGGLSGLNAALLLQSQGARVTVLEGSSRLGGRVHTADGIALRPEYGASQIGRSYARIIGTARRLGVELVAEDRELLPFSNHLDGRWVKAADWAGSDLNPLPDSLRATPPARVSAALLAQVNPLTSFEDWLDPRHSALDVSVEEILRRQNHSDAVIRLAALSSPSLSEVSALALMQEDTRGRIDRAFSVPGKPVVPGEPVPPETAATLAPTSNVKGGTSRLIEAMAAALHRPVARGKIVTRIDMQAARARVDCLDGSQFSADFVIAAVPFLQLRHIEVRPNFTGVQLDAVGTLHTLGTTRAYIAIREPFWHSDGLDPSFFSDGAIEMFWAIDNHRDRGEYRGMFVLTGDRAARLDGLPPADVPRFLLAELTRVRPAAKGKVEILTWNSWSTAPLIGCCRHMYAPGQITRFARDMIKPWQRLHLAGEHTRRNDFGMEAAMESGERAAVEVLSVAA